MSVHPDRVHSKDNRTNASIQPVMYYKGKFNTSCERTRLGDSQ